MNDAKDIRLAKRVKVEGNAAADPRNLGSVLTMVVGCKLEGEAADDGTQKEEKKDLDSKLGELRKLLVNDPKRLRYKDVDYLIRYMKTEDIISLAMTIDQEKEVSDFWYEEGEPFAPSVEKVNRLVSLMLLDGVEELEPGDLYILYNNFPKAAFGCMLLHALGSHSKPLHGSGCVYLKEKLRRATISKLCHVLPWRLFAHVMYEMTSLPVFNFDAITTLSVEKENLLKEAAENCEICFGKGKHSGVWGYYCSFWDVVPSGLPVGDSHVIVCRGCAVMKFDERCFVRCRCGSEIGQARPRAVRWKGC